LVITETKGKLELTYKSESVDSIVSPLENTRWTLIVCHRDSIIDAFNFVYGTTSLILAAGYTILSTAILTLLLFV
jgi:hypothetical protein